MQPSLQQQLRSLARPDSGGHCSSTCGNNRSTRPRIGHSNDAAALRVDMFNLRADAVEQTLQSRQVGACAGSPWLQQTSKTKSLEDRGGAVRAGL
jgi:hypothetical protein